MANRKTKGYGSNHSRHSPSVICSICLWVQSEFCSKFQASEAVILSETHRFTNGLCWDGWKHTCVNMECTYAVKVLSMGCCL